MRDVRASSSFGQIPCVLEVAGEFGLFVTGGGSDYHGRYGAPASVGERFVTPGEAGERVAALFSAERRLR